MNTHLAITIRSISPEDLEPLHQLYSSLADLLPHHPKVGLEQFAAEIVPHNADDAFDPDGSLSLVAERAGRPVAFASTSFLQGDARHSSLKAGAGVLRFVLASDKDGDACRTVIRAVVAESKARRCLDLRALMAQYGPRFHNYGDCGLSNAWPWIGRALTSEGFEAFWPTLALYRPTRGPIQRLPLPADADLRFEWVSRVGTPGEWEGGYHLHVGEERAAEVMWRFGGKYVDGLDTKTAYLFWLGTNAPYRGQGLGRAMLRAALVSMVDAGAKATCLRCRPDNFAAHAVYRAEGCEVSDLLWEFRWRGEP